LILQHEGRLNIHDPACNYLDDCPEAWQAITIRHLLTHTSGLPNYTDFIDFETTEMLATTPEELIARFRDMPLLFEPGSMYGYCNSGYVLLGVIIEQVAGQPYEEVLRTRIFEPLQMNDTGYDHNRESIEDQASGYTNINTRAPFLDASTLHAAGSLYSTVEDMYRWDQALYTEQLIPRPLLDEMFTPFHYGYAYGWRVRREGQRRVISHPGFITGFSNYIARYPDERVTIIILSNLEIAPSPGMSAHIAHLLFDPPDPADPPGEQDEQTTPAPGLEPAED
jgi:CubicO group peptidase (beta-lactamase class C family)